MVAVSLRTSALCYDLFQDNFVRSQLETRLAHLQPVELLLCTTLASPCTQALIKVRHTGSLSCRCVFDFAFSQRGGAGGGPMCGSRSSSPR